MIVAISHSSGTGSYLCESVTIVPCVGVAPSCREIAVVVVCVGNSVYRGGSVGIGIVGAGVGIGADVGLGRQVSDRVVCIAMRIRR